MGGREMSMEGKMQELIDSNKRYEQEVANFRELIDSNEIKYQQELDYIKSECELKMFEQEELFYAEHEEIIKEGNKAINKRENQERFTFYGILLALMFAFITLLAIVFHTVVPDLSTIDSIFLSSLSFFTYHFIIKLSRMMYDVYKATH